jgi:hypothetical protein
MPPHCLGPTTEFARTAPGFKRCLIGFRQVTNPRLLRQTHQKSGSFPPPELPGFNGTTTLSDSRSDRCLTAPLRPLPSSRTGLPRLRDPLSRRAVPTTPVDRSRCICRLLPWSVLPSPNSGRVGVHNFLSRPAQASHTLRPVDLLPHPRRGLSQGFDTASYPVAPPASYRANRPLPGWDLHPRGDRALRGTPEIAERNAEAEKKTGMAASQAPVNACGGRNRQEHSHPTVTIHAEAAN